MSRFRLRESLLPISGKKVLAGITAVVLISLVAFSAIPQETELKPLRAQMSKEFLEYTAGKTGQVKLTAEGYPLGLIPIPHDLSYLKTQPRKPRLKAAFLPASYDLRGQNKLTPVKNQGSCGSCWAFATYGSLESFLMPVELLDFSEQNLIVTHGFDYGPCEGGNILMSAAYLTRWAGPLREQDDPYIYAQGGPVKHVQEIIIVPGRSSSTDNEAIKEAVMNYGAVYTTMYWNSSFWNSTYKSYYNDGSNQEGSHAVAIVGWDDNFEASKFNITPPGNGAFIVRNSWGSTWGESGYFYVSYYDAYFAYSYNAVVQAENPSNYQLIYSYDDLGWVSTWGFSAETGWMANIFEVPVAYPLKAVGFYNPSLNSSFEIYIYKNVTEGQPRSGQLAATKTGNLSQAGYITIPLDKGVPLSTGELFSVVLKLTTPGVNYQICAEGLLVEDYSSQAVSNPGKSFISHDGTNWVDFGAYDPDNDGQGWDVCLKAYTGIEPIYPPLNLRITTIENNFIFFREKINRISWQANPDNIIPLAGYKIYRKDSSETNYALIATLLPDGLHYDDRALRNPDSYSYRVTSFDELGRESDPASPASGVPAVLKKRLNSYRDRINPVSSSEIK